MKRDTILFDINETVLDLSSLKPKFEAAFGHSLVLSLESALGLPIKQKFSYSLTK